MTKPVSTRTDLVVIGRSSACQDEQTGWMSVYIEFRWDQEKGKGIVNGKGTSCWRKGERVPFLLLGEFNSKMRDVTMIKIHLIRYMNYVPYQAVGLVVPVPVGLCLCLLVCHLDVQAWDTGQRKLTISGQ